MDKITATQLYRETSKILKRLEQGHSALITRHGLAIAKLSPVDAAIKLPWEDVMGEVWTAQKQVKRSERMTNPVLQERRRRRR